MPQEHFPSDLMPKTEIRVCGHCGKKFSSEPEDRRLWCPQCREWKKQYNYRYYHLTDEDIRARALEEREKRRALEQRLGTTNPQCLTFRSCVESGRMYDQKWTHHESCKACAEWFVKYREKEELNLNDTKTRDEYEDGYNQVFDSKQSSKPFGENLRITDTGNGFATVEEKQPYENITHLNDSDVLNSLHPLTDEEKEKSKKQSQLERDVNEQRKLG
jgi:predicted  nucleic acid-binding Zn-ribbon protein